MISMLLDYLHGDLEKIFDTVKKQAGICKEIIDSTNKKVANNISVPKNEALIFLDAGYYMVLCDYMVEYMKKFVIVTPTTTEDNLLYRALKTMNEEICRDDVKFKEELIKRIDIVLDKISDNHWEYPYIELTEYGVKEKISPLIIAYVFAAMEVNQGIIDAINKNNA